jgi:hypothetical protein
MRSCGVDLSGDAQFQRIYLGLGMVVHTYNASIQEAEEGRLFHTLSQKKNLFLSFPFAFLFFFLVVLEFELRVSFLLGRYSTI